MKIAQLLTASTGGIGRHVGSIAPRRERRGHQVRVFCPKATAEAQPVARAVDGGGDGRDALDAH